MRASGAVTLREFAKALVEMETAEINDLAAVLKEEYGIVPAKFEIKEAAGNVSITKSPKQVLKKATKPGLFCAEENGQGVFETEKEVLKLSEKLPRMGKSGQFFLF